MIKEISAAQLKQLLDQDKAILVDVRQPGEHATECIEGACLIPLDILDLEKLPKENKTIVVHCKSGRRSENACKKLLEANPNLDIYTLAGGIEGWKQAGLKVKSSGTKSCSIPIERQVLLTAGTLVVFGMAFGFFINQWFYLLSTFVGCGLMFAGISGWCGMAMLLAKMPWNN